MEYKIIEHTADTGIEVEAGSLEELFEGAATAMFSLMMEGYEPGGDLEKMKISLSAEDLEGLMFDWLNELLFTSDSKGMMLSNFGVSIFDTSLEAEFAGEPFDPAKHDTAAEVKAATYHQLTVQEWEGAWYARAILDV
jgi:SHS2 domain-containing protein